MKIETLENTDVRGKKLLYLKISKGAHNVFINVGEKTFKSVKDLENVQELPLPDTPKKEGGKK